MSRPIEFRAWFKENTDRSGLNYHKVGMYNIDLGEQYMDGTEFSEAMAYAESIMQFTGLLDKNGTKIFEGDIVRYNTGEIWVVEWNVRQAGFCYKNVYIKDSNGKKPSGVGFAQIPGSHEVEVIGNIYENPELLK